MRSQQTAAGVSWLRQQDPQQVCFFFCLLSFYGAFLCRNWVYSQDPQQVCFFFCFLSLYGAMLCLDWVYTHGCVSKILNKSLSFSVWSFVWSVASYRLGICLWLCQQDPQQVPLFFSLLFLYGPLLHLNWVLIYYIYAHGCVSKTLNILWPVYASMWYVASSCLAYVQWCVCVCVWHMCSGVCVCVCVCVCLLTTTWL